MSHGREANAKAGDALLGQRSVEDTFPACACSQEKLLALSDGRHTELLSQTHSATEDTSKGDIFTEDDCCVVFGQSNTELRISRGLSSR